MIAVPMTAGSIRKGTNAPMATSQNQGPPWYTIPYAVKMGIASRATIHDECATVSLSFARYRRNQSTGAAISMSRSFARKNVESAVTRLESRRIDANASRMTLSIFCGRNVPISGTLRA